MNPPSHDGSWSHSDHTPTVAFIKQLAKSADLFVNDAFGTAHRAHASTAGTQILRCSFPSITHCAIGVTAYLKPSVSGFLLQKELEYLQGAVDVPKRPFAAIVGGSKVSSKISVIESMLAKVDKLVLGGGMVFTFLKVQSPKLLKSLYYPIHHDR